MEERQLLSQIRHGDTQALGQAYHEYKDVLLTVAMGLLQDREQAEDVVHDVFVKFAARVGELCIRGSLKGYLITCAANAARDRIRTRVRHDSKLKVLATVPVSEADHEEHTAQMELAGYVENALQQLPDEQREAVVLRLEGDLAFKEIARFQKVSTKTAQSRYRYGIEKLRSLVNGEVVV